MHTQWNSMFMCVCSSPMHHTFPCLALLMQWNSYAFSRASIVPGKEWLYVRPMETIHGCCNGSWHIFSTLRICSFGLQPCVVVPPVLFWFDCSLTYIRTYVCFEATFSLAFHILSMRKQLFDQIDPGRFVQCPPKIKTKKSVTVHYHLTFTYNEVRSKVVMGLIPMCDWCKPSGAVLPFSKMHVVMFHRESVNVWNFLWNYMLWFSPSLLEWRAHWFQTYFYHV